MQYSRSLPQNKRKYSIPTHIDPTHPQVMSDFKWPISDKSIGIVQQSNFMKELREVLNASENGNQLDIYYMMLLDVSRSHDILK